MNKVNIFTLLSVTAFMLLSFKPVPVKLNPKRQVIEKIATGAKVIWVKDSHDFGEIAHGIPVSVEFSFTNNGDEALLISDVVTSCGCTASDYPKEAIGSGKSAKIKVTYNANAIGVFSKTITVKSNDQEAIKVLSIKGTVK